MEAIKVRMRLEPVAVCSHLAVVSGQGVRRQRMTNIVEGGMHVPSAFTSSWHRAKVSDHKYCRFISALVVLPK